MGFFVSLQAFSVVLDDLFFHPPTNNKNKLMLTPGDSKILTLFSIEFGFLLSDLNFPLQRLFPIGWHSKSCKSLCSLPDSVQTFTDSLRSFEFYNEVQLDYDGLFCFYLSTYFLSTFRLNNSLQMHTKILGLTQQVNLDFFEYPSEKMFCWRNR